MKTLTKKQVLALHSALIQEFGGMDGVAEEGLWSRHWRHLSRPSAGSQCTPPCSQKRRSLALA